MTANLSREEVDKEVLLDVSGRIATITLKREKKLNALTQDHYFRIAERLIEIGEMDDVVITIITGTGRFFSAGADVSIPRNSPEAEKEPRKFWNRSLVANNLHNTYAWYTHPKILVVALNGPAVGISAAYICHADFIYAAPHAYFLVPFTSLGLAAEGGVSKALVDRMGVAKATETLLTSRKVGAKEMKENGFVNKIIETGGGDLENGKGIDNKKFMDGVLEEVNDKLGEHLNAYSMLKIKKSIRDLNKSQMDAAGLEEVWGGLDVFMKGVPQREFAKIASGEKRHKL